MDFSRSENAPYKNKAEHELVIAKVKNYKFDEALDLARKCYERNPRNTYFIEAYFRCIINANVDENVKKEIIDTLIDSMKNSFEPSKDLYVDIFEVQKRYYLQNEPFTVIEGEIQKIIGQCDKSYPNEVLKDIQHYESCNRKNSKKRSQERY